MTNRFSNQIIGSMLVGVAVLALAPAVWADIPGAKASKGASGGSQGNPGVLPPNSSFNGHTYSEWSEKWWLWSFSLPADQNPTTNFAAPCTNGQSGHVWFLYGAPPTVNCTVSPGTALFFPVVNTECSSLEAVPFHGDTPAERSACAKAWIDNVTDLSATIDGVGVQNLAIYRVQSGDFPFTVPANNILGVLGPTSGFSSADGYYLLLAPLSAGAHTIHIKGTFHDPFDPTHPVVFSIDTAMAVTVGK
jgi:hypothetical protein